MYVAVCPHASHFSVQITSQYLFSVVACYLHAFEFAIFCFGISSALLRKETWHFKTCTYYHNYKAKVDFVLDHNRAAILLFIYMYMYCTLCTFRLIYAFVKPDF